MVKSAKIRLFVEGPLAQEQAIALNKDQANYLFAVMRLEIGAEIKVFNGVDGEWLARLVEGNKRGGVLKCLVQTQAQQMPPDVWILFAPIKKERTHFIVEKATELGAAKIQPIITEYTNSDRLKIDRLQAHALEATEQCGGTFVPRVLPARKFVDVVTDWPDDRQLMFCDERMKADPVAQVLAKQSAGKWAIIIGPEGGFSAAESGALEALPQSVSVSLGPRILRADTAVVAALTAWQSALGDWHD